MSSAAEIIKTALLAGTWSNHTWDTTNKAIYIYLQDKVLAKEIYILLTDEEGGDVIQSSDDALIYSTAICILAIFTRNTTDRDNIYTDVLAILEAYTSNSFTITSINYSNPKRDRKNMNLTIEVL